MLEYEVVAADIDCGIPKTVFWLFRKGGRRLTVADVLQVAMKEFDGNSLSNLHIIKGENAMILRPWGRDLEGSCPQCY